MKKIVVPGELLTAERKRPGEHVFMQNGKLYSDVIGILDDKPGDVSVIALEGKYVPRMDDVIVGVVGSEKATLVLPETMMNLSGKAVAAFVKTPKAAKNLLVIHDDLDLPLGTVKMVFGRGSGGHKGVESIMRATKTKEFARIRIGISAAGKKNQAKKVVGEEKVIKMVIGKWKPTEEVLVKKVLKKVVEAARIFATEDIEAAMLFANTR